MHHYLMSLADSIVGPKESDAGAIFDANVGSGDRRNTRSHARELVNLGRPHSLRARHLQLI
jgi:hypothetical protein